MDNLARKLRDTWTYADYLQWPDAPRMELMDGTVSVESAPGKGTDIRVEMILPQAETGRYHGQQLPFRTCWLFA